MRRRVFCAWSISIPATFSETFVDEDGYWHAWDVGASVSLSSIVLTDGSGPVPATLIRLRFPRLDGSPLRSLPPGLLGVAAEAEAVPPARASRVLSGMLAADGRALIVTITSDDVAWARRTWLSIRHVASEAPLWLRRPCPLDG